jgi:hypothetical protein
MIRVVPCAIRFDVSPPELRCGENQFPRSHIRSAAGLTKRGSSRCKLPENTPIVYISNDLAPGLDKLIVWTELVPP